MSLACSYTHHPVSRNDVRKAFQGGRYKQGLTQKKGAAREGGTITGDHSQYQVGPMVYIKTYVFNHFYWQYLVLLTMAPRTIAMPGRRKSAWGKLFSVSSRNMRVPLRGSPQRNHSANRDSSHGTSITGDHIHSGQDPLAHTLKPIFPCVVTEQN